MLKIKWSQDEIALTLRRLKMSLEDRAAVHRIMGEVLLRNTQRRFRREVSPEGKRWPALSPVTLAARRSKRGILRDSGELFGSIHMQPDLFGDDAAEAAGALPPPYQPKPEHVRAALRRLVGQMEEAADGWPWPPSEVERNRGHWLEHLCSLLPDEAEATRWRQRIQAQIERLDALMQAGAGQGG